MGYLTAQVPPKIVDCPDLYAFGLTIHFVKADLFMALTPQQFLALAIKAALPDVEDWQVSVIRKDHVKFRFRDTGARQIANEAILHAGFELYVTRVSLNDPTN